MKNKKTKLRKELERAIVDRERMAKIQNWSITELHKVAPYVARKLLDGKRHSKRFIKMIKFFNRVDMRSDIRKNKNGVRVTTIQILKKGDVIAKKKFVG